MLNSTEEKLVQLEDAAAAADTKLGPLTADAQKLERTVKELLDQVEFIKNSDIRGKKSHAKSGDSDKHLNSSTDFSETFGL